MEKVPVKTTRFSRGTLDFIEKAARQKSRTWLDRHRKDYEAHLLGPIHHLASRLKTRLASHAPGYRFPQTGLARMKRSENRAREYGALYRDYVSYSAARPRVSRFDHNPNLFFLIYPADEDGDQVLIAGGLYMPSSRQLRAIRERISSDEAYAAELDRLFASKTFASRFRGGFSDERKAKRNPRGFDPAHPRIEWLKLQAFFVWRPYSRKEFISKDFADLVADDCAQILRLNELLNTALSGRPVRKRPEPKRAPSLLKQLDAIEAPKREMDF